MTVGRAARIPPATRMSSGGNYEVPGMTYSVGGKGRLNISGKATAAGRFLVTLNGKTAVTVAVLARTASQGILPLIQKALPRGFRATMEYAADNPNGVVGIKISDKSGKLVSLRVSSNPQPSHSGPPADATTPELWYMQWKAGGKAPPASVHGVFRFGDVVVKVDHGVVTKPSGMFSINGRNVVVEKGAVVGEQG